MRLFSLRIFLLQFWLVWALVIVPAHTRGAISNGGAGGEPLKASMLLDSLPACCRGEKTGKEPARSPENCAICQAVSHTTHPPALPVFDYKMEELAWGFLVGARQECGEGFDGVTRSRGPPESGPISRI